MYFHKTPANKDLETLRTNVYCKPLMQFFHTCIEYERRNEINKQELVLAEDFSIYNAFKALAGPGRKFLALCDLQTILAKHFEVQYSYRDVKLSVLRQGGAE